MMFRTVALVQARMGSSRFPGKMLSSLGSHSVLEWVLIRLSKADLLDDIVVATTNLEKDNVLENLAINLGFKVFRGSEGDVLGRFAAAANMHDARSVVRVCADNPFIEPLEINRLIENYHRSKCDYAFNHLSRLGSNYADGFGAEILGNDLLQKLNGSVTQLNHREHATSYLWDHIDDYNILAIPAPKELAYPEYRFDIDTPSDLDYLRKVVEQVVNIKTAASDILKMAKKIN